MPRWLGFGCVLLIAAALVGRWGVATRMITMDSPFASFDFRAYAVFSLIGEVALGLPYAFMVRAALRWSGHWSVVSMWLAALLPGAIVTFLEAMGHQRLEFGPAMLIAAAALAVGWQVFGSDRRPAHG